MSYEKQSFEDGQVLTAAQLNHIEDGIASKRVLLWRTPTDYVDSPFEPQRILLAPVTCDGIEIVYCTTDDGHMCTTGFLPNRYIGSSSLFSIDIISEGFSRRDFYRDWANDMIEFYDGQYIDFANMSQGWSAWTVDQYVCIPVAVYGINL